MVEFGSDFVGELLASNPRWVFENRWVLQKLCPPEMGDFLPIKELLYNSIYQERVRWQLRDEFCLKTFV